MLQPPRERPEAARPEPVVHHAHPHARPRPLGQRFDHLVPEWIVGEDVELDQDRALRRTDRREPRRKVLLRVAQQAHGVARHERGTGGAEERAFGEHALGALGHRGPIRRGHDAHDADGGLRGSSREGMRYIQTASPTPSATSAACT